MFDMKGKAVLMAGGAGYLSAPACLALAGQGADVMVAEINKERMDALVAEAGSRHPDARICGTPLDVRDARSIQCAVRRTVEEFGRLDILVNAAYKSIGKLVEELSGEEFDDSLHVNVTGAFLLAREASAAMSRGGSIILFSSMYGQISPDPGIYRLPIRPNPIEYGVAKAGIEQMVRYLAVCWAPRNIRVNGIAPGPFPHAWQREQHPDWMERMAAKTPMNRIGRQDEVAGAVVFLASDAASYITGHILKVDGGWTVW
jgi:NAD(P)-dependent dehydrogenase (short-subunit alcohol dehydrogenase family)